MSARRAGPPPPRAPFVEVEAEVVANQPLAGTRLWWLELAAPADALPAPAPGQFAMIAPPGAEAAGIVLARPFSIARAWTDGTRRVLGILYARVGRGTDLMTRVSRGRFRVLGPLGRGFPLDGRGPALLVGGGRGTAPLVILAEELEAAGRDVHFLVGARGRGDFAGPHEMGARVTRTRVWEATEDGSRGHRGRVLDLLEREAGLAAALDASGAALFTCGPHGLLAAVHRLGEHRRVPVHASIEAHMACGTGICRSCVVPRPRGGPRPPAGANPDYLIACVEGPVVDSARVDWARDRETIVSAAFAGAGAEEG
jgi:dihydroorotate dehydrogenase electron transfer subunit